MAEELFYTSAERGLRPGTRGFCTVAYTQGMTLATIRLLESLSAYKGVYAAHDARAVNNPVAISHYRYSSMGRNINILSRVGDSKADQTKRTNKLAHHVVLSRREQVPAGPAWLAAQPGFLDEVWTGPPRQLDPGKEIPDGDVETTHAAAWEARTGDAGWAGMLAHAFLARRTRPSYLVFEPGMAVLPLLVEALALIRPELRWQVTFSTYFTSPPAGMACAWRCCVPDAYCLREARRTPRTLVVDLTRSDGEPDSENVLVQCARNGTPLEQVPQPAAAGPRFVMLANRRQKALRMGPARPADEPGGSQ